jgi:DNA-binding NtrC family response regulator
MARSVAPVLAAVRTREQLQRENERLRARAGESVEIVGQSSALRQVLLLVAETARSDINVLITGETGTGKELVARQIHAQSPRNRFPLIIVNCAAIPRELFEGELFGYKKGAFTNADADSPGLLIQSQGGTLFLDEIGDLSPENQARILRVIENRTFRPLGKYDEIKIDARFIAATNKDLPAAVEAGRFRADLFHRLQGIEIPIAPLRERTADIPLLAEHFIALYRNEAKCPVSGINPDAMERLASQPWPGNVRELRNRIQRAMLLTHNSQLVIEDVGGGAPVAEPGPGEEARSLPLAEIEKRHIIAALRQCAGNVRQTAEALQISRATLYNKIAEYQIEI